MSTSPVAVDQLDGVPDDCELMEVVEDIEAAFMVAPQFPQ